MKKSLAIFAFLASVLTARAALDVEWIDGNTIRVSGDGYTVVTNVVYTNSLGTCTNCVQISPEQMREYKSSILSECDAADSDIDGIIFDANEIYERMNDMLQDISYFQRYNKSMTYASVSNFLYKLPDSTQRDLSLSNFSSFSGSLDQKAKIGASYNNGIYDFANTYVLPEVSASKTDAEEIVYQANGAKYRIDTIRTIVSGMSESTCACQGDGAGTCPTPGGGGGGDSSGDCPCADQLDAIKDYVEHIDDDFHVQLQNMSDVTNFIPRMDSYAKLVAGILYNDATIVVDDGENSWSNVYRRGYSDLYDYDKSNILQRIELLLFGLTSNTGSDWSDSSFDSLSDVVNESNQAISDALDIVSQSKADIEQGIRSIRSKIEQLWDNLNFFGAGQLVDFEIIHPFKVFDMYDISASSRYVGRLDGIRNISRTACQVIYWVVAVVVMLLFYYKCVSLTFAWFGSYLKFFNGILS